MQYILDVHITSGLGMDLRRVDLNLLVVFDAVYRTGKLSAAGEALALSQPAMSHALRRLRETLKDPLFVRLPRGLQPTPFADELAGGVTRALAELRNAIGKPKFDPAEAARLFRIAMTDIGEQVFLPKLARHLQAAAPEVSLQAYQLPVKELLTAMYEGEIDLAMGFIPQLRAGFFQQ